jgi:hypothetical protein
MPSQFVHSENDADPWTLPPRREPMTWDLRQRRWGNNIDLIRRDLKTGDWEALLIASGGPYGISRPAAHDLVLLKAKDGGTLTYRIERCRPMSDPSPVASGRGSRRP